MIENNQPIGIFDSGIGGVSIWNEVNRLMPHEQTIYLADSKNAPYGDRSKEDIVKLCTKNVDELLLLNCKIIIVACNTATTNAIKELRADFDIPFIGIEPAIKPAATNSRTQIIGILATKGTLSSELFTKTVEFHSNVKIIEQVGYGLVQLIEAGRLHSPEMTDLLKKCLTPMIKGNIDYLVLGCSHYPFLISQIKAILPSHIQIIDSGEAVAKQTQNVLRNVGFNTLGKGSSIFYTNSDPLVLNSIVGNTHCVEYRDF